jgi:FkbM family methyltransferase
LAGAVSAAVGRESLVVKAFDPLYRRFLEWTEGGDGVPRDLNGVTYLFDPRYFRGGNDYEPAVAQFLRARVRPGAVCLDVGANVGLHLLQFAHWSAPDGRVIGFEPNPYALAAAAKHVRINRLSDRVELLPFAVGAAHTQVTMHTHGASSEDRLGEPAHGAHGSGREIPVTVVTLDAWCESRGIAPDWILIDIEGFELHALRGARSVIEHGRPRLGLVVEMHPQFWSSAGSSRSDAEALLCELRLRPVPLTGQSNPLREYGLVHLAYE